MLIEYLYEKETDEGKKERKKGGVLFYSGDYKPVYMITRMGYRGVGVC